MEQKENREVPPEKGITGFEKMLIALVVLTVLIVWL